LSVGSYSSLVEHESSFEIMFNCYGQLPVDKKPKLKKPPGLKPDGFQPFKNKIYQLPVKFG
jgi:hypothetical protein